MFAEMVADRLRAAGHAEIPVREIHQLTPGICEACGGDSDHPACAVVVVAIEVAGGGPLPRLDGQSVACCWQRLPSFLAECYRGNGVLGFTVEVPA